MREDEFTKSSIERVAIYTLTGCQHQVCRRSVPENYYMHVSILLLTKQMLTRAVEKGGVRGGNGNVHGITGSDHFTSGPQHVLNRCLRTWSLSHNQISNFPLDNPETETLSPKSSITTHLSEYTISGKTGIREELNLRRRGRRSGPGAQKEEKQLTIW